MNDLVPPIDDPRTAHDATSCGVDAFGVVQIPMKEIAGLRKTLAAGSGRPIPASLLKHADPQTVIGLASLLKAVDDFGWRDREFTDWGIIASPRFLGRINSSAALYRFRQTGAPGVSPLIIPTLCLHAVAGSLSLAMKCHGFNYGVGGGHGHLGDGLLSGLAARDDNVPGIWVVATQFSPEPRPDRSGVCTNQPVGHAVALCLNTASADRCRLNLRLVPTLAAGSRIDVDVDGNEPESGLVGLAEFLQEGTTGRKLRRWHCSCAGMGTLQLEDDPARARGALDAQDGLARAG